MVQPEVGGAGATAAATANSIAANGKRLGLTWARRVATVIDPDTPTAIFDGDLVPLRMTSMTGYALVAGNRVYVDIIPPSGLFILGRVGVPVGPTYRTRQTLSAAAASVTFSAIPTNLRSLQLRWKARSDTAALLALCSLRINGVATANYTNENVQGNGAAVTAAATVGATQSFVGHAAAATSPVGLFGTGIVEFDSWDLTSTALTWTYVSGAQTSGALTHTGAGIYTIVGPWTSIQLIPGAGSWIAGSDFQLEGIYA